MALMALMACRPTGVVERGVTAVQGAAAQGAAAQAAGARGETARMQDDEDEDERFGVFSACPPGGGKGPGPACPVLLDPTPFRPSNYRQFPSFRGPFFMLRFPTWLVFIVPIPPSQRRHDAGTP